MTSFPLPPLCTDKYKLDIHWLVSGCGDIKRTQSDLRRFSLVRPLKKGRETDTPLFTPSRYSASDCLNTFLSLIDGVPPNEEKEEEEEDGLSGRFVFPDTPAA